MKIHFIGIGGIGVSALAQYYLAKGHKVSGTDLAHSEIIDLLKRKDAKVFVGKHSAKNIPTGADLIIYSPAVSKNNPELKKAREQEIKRLSYPEALGQITKKYFTIAVAGTHGKSTTTAMLSLIMKKAGLEPNVIVGTKLKEFGNSNFLAGAAKYLVIEADEHFASFLNYLPRIIVLTNIEKDHLDYYKNLKNILASFQKFIGRLPSKGILVFNKDDKNIKTLLKEKGIKRGRESAAKEKNKINASGFSIKDDEAKRVKKILKVPGEHNVYNALAAFACARKLGIDEKQCLSALSEYKGVWRRFEEKAVKINKNKIVVVNDYGHHPTEIKATLKAAREKFGQKNILCIFQPHQYQRTALLFNDFVKVFSEALKPGKNKPMLNGLIITDIYDVAGRERGDIKKKTSSQKLAFKIKNKNAIYISQKDLGDCIEKRIVDVLIIMGAGDIYSFAEELSRDFVQSANRAKSP